MRQLTCLVVVLAVLGCAAKPTDSCRPLPDTKPEDLRSIPWVEIQKPEGFCGVVTAYQYQVYKFGSLPVLIADNDGFDGEMTFPEGTVATRLTGGGAEVQFGTTSGQVCGRHFNSCTAPGPFACQPLTVVANNVFAPLRTTVAPFFSDGAMAWAAGAVWYLQPRYHFGVWRMDAATSEWTNPVLSFPEGQEAGGDFTGGVAIGVGTDIWYLSNQKAFRFDTTSLTWSAGVTVTQFTGWYATGVAFDGKLYVHQEGELNQGGGFFVFDPATKVTTALPISGFQRKQLVGFVRNGKLVFGGGHECDFRTISCWKQNFKAFDPVTQLWAAEPYIVAGGRSIGSVTAALDFSDKTLLLSTDGSVWELPDGATTVTAWKKNPALTSCTAPSGPPTAYLGASQSFGDRALSIGGEGSQDSAILYLK